MDLLLATRNAHKTREFSELLGPDFKVRDLTSRSDLPIVDETGSTFVENAALKALAISTCVSGWVVADDSGLEVEALNGAPGIFSARYAGGGVLEEALMCFARSRTLSQEKSLSISSRTSFSTSFPSSLRMKPRNFGGATR